MPSERHTPPIGGHCPIFARAMRHAAFLHNRVFVGVRGAPAYEILNGRKYRGKLLPSGELCIFHKPSRHKGDPQWRRGKWVGINEWNGAHILLTEDGACESTSIRRLPAEDQWSCKEVLGARGLFWDYGGPLRLQLPSLQDQLQQLSSRMSLPLQGAPILRSSMLQPNSGRTGPCRLAFPPVVELDFQLQLLLSAVTAPPPHRLQLRLSL